MERFLKQQAIANEKGNRSRTYLLVEERDDQSGMIEIVGYFVLAISIMRNESAVSMSKKRRLAGMFYDKRSAIQVTPCFLIGQMGLNDRSAGKTNGGVLLKEALDAVLVSWTNVGGRFVRIDCIDSPGLISFYERHGFEFVQRNGATDLVEMVLVL